MELSAVALFLKGNYYLCGGGGLVTKLCPTLVTPMGCSPPVFSVHGILQARILEWVAISFSRGSSRHRNWTWVSCTAGRFFPDWATEFNASLECFQRRSLILEPHFLILPPHPWADHQYHPQNQHQPCGHSCSQINVCGYMCVCVICICLCVCVIQLSCFIK